MRRSSTMRRLLRFPPVVLLAATMACSDSGPASPAPAPGEGGTITGRERFGWTQTAPSASELSTYRYAVYVDGSRRVVEGETCSEGTGAAFECAAPLPPLTAGRHTLELAAFVIAAGSVIEGPRSAPLQVTIAALTAPAPADAIEGGTLVSSDGLRFEAAILSRDLVDPVDLATAPDGRVFVAEQSGRVRIFAEGEPAAAPGHGRNILADLREGEATLLSIALAPDFARTRLLHVAYGTVDRGEPVLRIARFREAAATLAQGAVISSHEVPAGVSATIRFGPDRHLYAGIGSGAHGGEAQNLASDAGKILRLREDGSTPEDNPWSSPVYSVGHRDPRGLAWRPLDHSLWEVERDDGGDELNAIRAGANFGWPVVRGLQTDPRVTAPSLVLPAGTLPSGIATVGARASPLFGDLIVAALGGEDLLRLRFGADGRARIAGRLLQRRFARVGQVASGPDGALYLITANRDTWGPGQDMLVRLLPD